MRALNKKAENVGWLGVSNGIGISIYYAAVFAWVIMMFFMSFKFMNMTGDNEAASSLWMKTIKTTGVVSGFKTIAWPVFGCLLLAWALCYLCIRNGTTTVGKVVKYAVSIPVICLLIMAVRGFTMSGAMSGISKLCIPKWSALKDSNLWVDAIGQVFYSLSTSMAIMFAWLSRGNKRMNGRAVAGNVMAIVSIVLGLVVLAAILLAAVSWLHGAASGAMMPELLQPYFEELMPYLDGIGIVQ